MLLLASGFPVYNVFVIIATELHRQNFQFEKNGRAPATPFSLLSLHLACHIGVRQRLHAAWVADQ
ncbi:hypothetical protein BN2497_7879 [Janthinobacterium sp. CG23_2]|nr:hypothetical protein BN2497_7879 [Janthinobacterium sp. CG23_2]CUU30337.1 hypothetical protein BN3177_7879 [Janthinobacterium sp. CG23_2]